MNINAERKRSIEMKSFEKYHLLQRLLIANILFLASASEEIPVSYCGSLRIQEPFFHQNSSHSSLLTKMILCKSEKLYFRTSIGLFQIHSINYENKLITLSHTSFSPTSHFELGTRISFDVPDHVPNPCDECKKPNGSCGVGLRCACHPKKCKDRVISAGADVELCASILVFFGVVVIVFLHGF